MITTYDYIESNKRKTILLVFLFPISLLVLLFVALYLTLSLYPALRVNNIPIALQIIEHYWLYFLICILFSALWTIFSFYQGSGLLLSTISAIKTGKDDSQNKEIQRILENISITAGIPTPELYVLEGEEGMNAFAVGTTKKNAAVILTKGLVEKLDNSELEAVIAHEIAHIIHQDTKLMVIVTLLIGFFTYFGYIITRMQFGGRSSRNNSKGGVIIFVIGLVFLLYGYVVAPLLRLAVSRTREFQADAKSALLTRNPQALISALRKIERHPIVNVFNSKVNDNELMAPMCIENPLRKKVSLFDSLSNLSSTHPPVEKRIQALEVMDGRSLFPY